MSLLTAPSTPTVAQSRANRALGLPRQMFNRLLNSWRDGLKAVWDSPDPAAVLAAMGTQGAELFNRSSQLRAFLEQQQPGSTNIPAAAKIKPVTIQPDGTVNLA